MPRAATLALACCALLAAAPAPASTDGSNMTTNKVTTIKRPADTATVRPAPEIATALPKARLVGRGSLRFFGLLVYEARLWAAPGFAPERYAAQPFALELEYARKLGGDAIAERSVVEMRRVGEFDDARAKAWLDLMLRAFPTVAAKDRLTGVHDGRGGVAFFHNGQPTASVADAEFARLFFGIWLAPQTSAPALRQALIGSGDDA